MTRLERLSHRVRSRTGIIVVAAASVVGLPSATAADNDDTAIRPFKVNVPEATLVDLRRRLAATRWPDPETVPDQSQGVQSATMKELVRYWQKDYDWRKAEAKLNALPQFVTTIDGLDIHFIHVRSKHENALPVIITHGWPGSIIEELKIIEPLTNPTAHGGSASDAFHVVIPSMPGYGFSGKPTTTGWNTDRIARAWDTLMKHLGYTRYVSQGGDWGARICEALAHQAPQGLLGVHMTLLLTFPPEIARAFAAGEPPPSGLSEAEKAAYEQRKLLNPIGFLIMQARRPQTIGYSLAESPVGLAAWLLDHDPHSYERIAHAFEGHPEGALTRDEILDNITLYWATNTGASAARLYWEAARRRLHGGGFRCRGLHCFSRRDLSCGVGLSARSRTSFTSTKSTRAATSRRGSSRSRSLKRSERRSDRYGKRYGWINRTLPAAALGEFVRSRRPMACACSSEMKGFEKAIAQQSFGQGAIR